MEHQVNLRTVNSDPSPLKMDFGKFSDVDFGVKEWVNGALAAHKGSQTSLDVSGIL